VIPPHGEVYDPATNSWSALSQAPLPGRLDSTAVWTGRSFIVWGGRRGNEYYRDGAVFTPS
jgi:hypothetical protein